MAVLSKSAYESKYNSSGSGSFLDNTSESITEATMREFAKDTADSFVHKDDLSAGGLMVKSLVTLLSPQVLTANATPVEIVASPGAGKYLMIHSWSASMDYNSIAYTTNTQVYLDFNGTQATQSADLLSGTSDKAVISAIQTLNSIPLNTALDFKVDTGNPAAGNSPIKVVVYYSIEEI